MADPAAQAATQLANIEASLGKSVDDVAGIIQKEGLEKHGQIVSYLKGELAMTHGNANLLAHKVREKLAGGPAAPDDLLAAQYEGAKAGLLPIYAELAAFAEALGGDVESVVQKTGVSFRRAKQFALVQAPSSKRVQLGLNLDETPGDDRIRSTSGMCKQRVDLTSLDDVDDDVRAWIRESYESAG